jgi:hypothetical protein
MLPADLIGLPDNEIVRFAQGRGPALQPPYDIFAEIAAAYVAKFPGLGHTDSELPLRILLRLKFGELKAALRQIEDDACQMESIETHQTYKACRWLVQIGALPASIFQPQKGEQESEQESEQE